MMGHAMRHITRVIVAAGLLAAWSGSTALGAAPTTQPRAGRVVVLPFAQTNPQPSQQAWVGQAIRQGLLSALMPYAPGRVRPLDVRAGDDNKAAIDAARKAGAAYAVTGSVVTAGTDVRFNGQVLDVESGDAVAPLKATGPADDLYALETALADQLGRAIGLTIPAAPAAAGDANPWGTNDYLAANPYAPGTGDAGAAGGADFGPNGYGAYGPFLGPLFIVPGARHHHDHHGNSGNGSHAAGQSDAFDDTPFDSFGVPSIAGGGGNVALDGGLPFGQFIPTNRAQSREFTPYGVFIPTNRAESRTFNAFGGSGTVDISRPTGPSGFRGRATGGHAAGAGRK